MKAWDAVIIGGGPAGLAAGLHLARAGYSTLLAEGRRFGGQAASIGRIENYPGSPGEPGRAMMGRWLRQARGWGLTARLDEALSVSSPRGGLFTVRLKKAGPVGARAVLWCGGAAFRELDLPGEQRLRGRGVWNTADEAPSVRGKTAAVIGGGEAAAQQAAALARDAREVFLLCRGTGLKAHRLLKARLAKAGVQVVCRAAVSGLAGPEKGGRIVLSFSHDGEERRLAADAVFVLIGKEPRRVPARWQSTPEGFFEAGDSAGGIYRQVAVAGGDGIRAAMRAVIHLERKRGI